MKLQIAFAVSAALILTDVAIAQPTPGLTEEYTKAMNTAASSAITTSAAEAKVDALTKKKVAAADLGKARSDLETQKKDFESAVKEFERAAKGLPADVAAKESVAIGKHIAQSKERMTSISKEANEKAQGKDWAGYEQKQAAVLFEKYMITVGERVRKAMPKK